MARSLSREVKKVLRDHGCFLVRQGRGDHEIWESPITNIRFTVDGKILSRFTANAVMKQAGIEHRF